MFKRKTKARKIHGLNELRDLLPHEFSEFVSRHDLVFPVAILQYVMQNCGSDRDLIPSCAGNHHSDHSRVGDDRNTDAFLPFSAKRRLSPGKFSVRVIMPLSSNFDRLFNQGA